MARTVCRAVELLFGLTGNVAGEMIQDAGERMLIALHRVMRLYSSSSSSSQREGGIHQSRQLGNRDHVMTVFASTLCKVCTMFLP